MAEISVTRNGLTLAAIAAVCTGLVAFTHRITDERIAANEQAWLEQSLLPVIQGIEFDFTGAGTVLIQSSEKVMNDMSIVRTIQGHLPGLSQPGLMQINQQITQQLGQHQ